MRIDTTRLVDPPAPARAGTGLARIDYCDSYLTTTSERDSALTAEAWARCVIEGASRPTRARLVTGWFGLGLGIHPWRGDTVLGWTVRSATPERLLLGVGSRIGMPAELLLERYDEGWLFATRVQLGGRFARGLWPRVVPTHVRTVTGLLNRAAAQRSEQA